MRDRPITVHLDQDEREWLRRHAHWEGASVSELMRRALHSMVCEHGYLRPPDDEPQDFGEEKEQMQWVITIQEAGKRISK